MIDDGRKAEELLRNLSFTIKLKGREALKTWDVTPPQFELMVKLYFNGEMNQTDLAKSLYSAKSTVSDLLERLEKRRFVKRARKDDDKRIAIVTLTDKGKAVIESVIEERVKYVEKLLEQLSTKERKAFISVLEKINTRLSS